MPSPITDSLGLPLSTASAPAAQCYERGIDHQLHAWPGGEAALREALLHDPHFALAQAALALVLQSQGRSAEARSAIAAAGVSAGESASAATERERAHITLLAHAIEGRPTQALAAVIEHAQIWPRDALALSIALGAFGLFAFSGQADHDQQRLAFVRRIAPHYPDDHVWMLTHRGWALIEAGAAGAAGMANPGQAGHGLARPDTAAAGLIDAGLALVERSLALRPANGNAAHVMAHARFERDEPQVALDFIEAWLPSYPAPAMLYGHLNWHAALCEIDLGRMDAAAARLVGVIEPHLQHALPLVGMTDTSSLLWRLALQGRRGLSWARAQAYADERFPQGGNAFVEAHLAMLAAAQRDEAALQRCADRLQRSADAGQGGAATALQWAQGLMVWCRSQGGAGAAPGAARTALDACLAQAARLGGSHAQRTVIGRTRATRRLPCAAAPTAATLRPATPADALLLGVLATQVFLDTYAFAGIGRDIADEVRSAFSTEAFSAILASPATFITVAEIDGALIGFAQTTLGTPQALAPMGVPAELDRLYVQEPFTRQGWGARLLREHEALAAARGAQVMWLSPWVGNARALRFYAKQGYADHGQVVFQMGSAQIENRVYAKRLAVGTGV